MQVCMYACMHVCMYVCIYILFIHMCVKCVCAWKYSETTSHRDHRSSFHRDHRRLAAHVLHQNAQPLGRTSHDPLGSTGWWLSHLPLWKMMEWVKVSWDDDSIPNCFWKVIKFRSSKPPDKTWRLIYPSKMVEWVKVSWDFMTFPRWWESHSKFHGSKLIYKYI